MPNKQVRKYFTKKQVDFDPSYLFSVQQNSYSWFFEEGLRDLFDEINPIVDFIGRDFELYFDEYALDEPKFNEKTVRFKNLTYEAPLRVKTRLVNKKTGDIKEQDVYLGDFPLMTERGTFIINGIERAVISQLVRSPGVFFSSELIRGRRYYNAKVIPNRGAWIEINTDYNNVLWVKIDRKRKITVTSLLQAFGMNIDDIKKTFAKIDSDDDISYIESTLAKDTAKNQEEALIELYKRIRPGDLATADNAKSLIFAMFFNFERYDFGKVGRYKINKRFDFDFPNIPENRILKMEDLVAVISEIISLNITQKSPDDIDHLSNRRIRSVGELLQGKMRVGLARMRRIIKDKMSTLDIESVTPMQLINSRPVSSSVKEFFMSSQLSQFMDQVNPLAELEHKRRLSVIGPGGLSRERAGFEVRDVHRTHYGKICPIETPEGANIGLVGHLALYARVNEYGFLESPYKKVLKEIKNDESLLLGKILNENVEKIAKKGDLIDEKLAKKISSLKTKKNIKVRPFVSSEIDYLTSSEEEKSIISISYNLKDGYNFKKDYVEARIDCEAATADIFDVTHMDISAKQIVGVSAALIPFLEHTDAHRALMAANMQRQSVPCIIPDSPVVGTGIEKQVAEGSGQLFIAPVDGEIVEIEADYVKMLGKDKEFYDYYLNKFLRSNAGTCLNQKIIVNVGDKVKKGDIIVDGAAIQNGELALGQNLTVAFMSFEGGNYEDAILLSERIVQQDKYTSIHIDTKVINVRDTKLGPEVVTRDIPNISEDRLKDLDEEGIIRIGAEVSSGDILIGKITPKGETELSSEERLLRAIFGDKAKDVRDTSLYLDHGERGKVVDVKVFSRDAGDKLSAGVIKTIEISVATLRKVQVGDKMAGRYGNKGVISRIVRIEDMPYMEDGTPVDILLNPLGVISRMNLGQIFEVHLGLAAKALGYKVASPVFDGIKREEIEAELEKAGFEKDGKINLFDGRTGEKFKERTTVGVMYLMKLNHLVEDKIHQRSIGSYSLVTQQPLGGRAQFGGQRFGEMEVWALEGYGASHTLQEMLTIKSDDVNGRSKAYESIIRGKNIDRLDIPESFNVLVREIKGLCLDVQLLSKDKNNGYQDVTDIFVSEEDSFTTSKNKDFDAIKLVLASPEKIKSWSKGEVLKPETINYRTQKPERDGLFCERIFGPVKDWECACGKYRKIRYKGIVCDKCGVEVTKSSVRRGRFGHIELAVPVSHIWFLRGIPSKIGLVLNMSAQSLDKIIYFADFVITTVDEELKTITLEKLNNEYKSQKKVISSEYKQKEVTLRNKKATDKEIEALKDECLLELDKLREEFDETRADLNLLKVKEIISEDKYRNLSIKFGHIFDAGIGAEAVYKLLEGIDLEKVYKEMEENVNKVPNTMKKRFLNRMRLLDNFIRNNIKPEWMILKNVPVIPPSLRPMVQLDGGRFASSDLNDLYRRIINRNNRLKRLISINAPEVIVRNEKRMLQEAVDALIDNGARKGKTMVTATGQKRPLKSIADSLKGKQGRFRQNLLGKRVDYSGRSVIVIGPKLDLDQCGIPKKMAIELFKPFVISQLINREIVYNIRAASRMIAEGSKEVWDILEEVVKDAYVLLNRAPTLHRLGVQAFKPILINGKAIQLHPLVCSAFNADFDGDQMAVHVPLSDEAIKECREIMLSKHNLLKPATGDPMTVPGQDMVLGAYYLTNIFDVDKFKDSNITIFRDFDEFSSYFYFGNIEVGDRIAFRDEESNLIITSAGRAIFNNILPYEVRKYDTIYNKKNIKKLVSELLDKFGMDRTSDVLDAFKNLTFEFLTRSGISIGLGDLPNITSKKKVVIEGARSEVEKIKEQFDMGFLTDQERKRKVIEVWTSIKDVIAKISQEAFDKRSPFYMMADSGARGSMTQVNQMVGMKGLVANPLGETIELPIRHSFQEGFDVLEYFISTHGARKGLTDTALKTSSAGYLTRRLVDVAQDMSISETDCGDTEGVLITKEECEEIGENIEDRIFGRISLEDIIDRDNNEILVKSGDIISRAFAKKIADCQSIESVKVRSVLSCKSPTGICSKCYGYDLSTNSLVKVGTPIGVVAAQSIGEPGTQLVLRTFHSGGTAGSDITQGLPRVEELFEARSVKKKAYLSEYDGKISISKPNENKEIVITITYSCDEEDEYLMDKNFEVLVSDGDKVKIGTKIYKDANSRNHSARHDGVIRIKDGYLAVVYHVNSSKDYIIPFGYEILVENDQFVSKGDMLTDGSIDLHELYELKGEKAVQKYILAEIQHVYSSQGQDLNDKHVEVIIRRMLSRRYITDSGDTEFISGDVVSRDKLVRVNKEVEVTSGKPAKAKTLLMGITKVSACSDSWLSAASFQETTKALINASISGEIDELKGLKENVIIGRLIPVGTGYRK